MASWFQSSAQVLYGRVEVVQQASGGKERGEEEIVRQNDTFWKKLPSSNSTNSH